MSQAVWTLLYSIRDRDRARYLEWFHAVHVPEKLARPGYAWAAHYEHDDPARPDRRGYVALFGGDSTRVFFDPSPAQLRTRQDAQTREMMGCRVDGTWLVHCEEWHQPGAAGEQDAAISAPALWLDCLDAGGADEALQAWAVQQQAPAAAAAAGCLGTRKWLAASAGPRHAVAVEYVSLDAAAVAAGWAGDGGVGPARPQGPPRLGSRIWPD